MKCEFFGVRSSKKANVKKMCDKCGTEKFKKCTIETNTIMGTSVVVDRHGSTQHVLPKGEISDTELMFENFDGSAKKETVKEEKKTKKATKAKVTKAKSARVTGISKLCRSLRLQNVSDKDIEAQVAQLYTNSGGMTKSAAQAKAKSCVAHMVWDR